MAMRLSCFWYEFNYILCRLLGTNLLFQWDTAGQERFRTITGSFYKNTNGVAICFDLSNKKSFERLEKWFEQVEQYGETNLPCILFGTKSVCLNSNDVKRHCLPGFRILK